MKFTYVKPAPAFIETKLHISHLYNYVSAYVGSKEEIEDLVDMISFAIDEAKEKGQTQIVDKDGEFCFHVTPMGYVILMIPWKIYEIIDEGKYDE
jgi:hypothetical protein